MTAVEKANSSPVLAVLAKFGMFLTPIMVSIALFVIGNYLDAQAKAIGVINDRLTMTEKVSANFDTRLTVVESREETQARETAKVVESIAALVEAINQDRLTSTRNDAEIRKDVGFLRDWVEEVKRREKTP